MPDRMEQLKAMANDGYAPAIWAVAEIERLRQKINRADRYIALGSPNAARDVLNECGTIETG